MGTSVSSSTRSTPAPEHRALASVVARLLAAPDDEERRRCLEEALRAVPTDQLLPALKDESERYQNIDPAASLCLAGTLVQAAQLAGRPDHQALGVMATGDALRALNRYPEAVETLDRAAELFRALGDEVGWARTRIGWVFAAHYVGRGDEALQVAAGAREILVSAGAWQRVAGLDQNAAWIAMQLGRFAESLAFHDRALAAFAALGPAFAAHCAYVQRNKAALLFYLGDLPTALALLEDARHVFAERGITIAMLRADCTIATVYADQGHYAEALRRYGEARRLAEGVGSAVDVSWIALNMVECYLRLNRLDEAIEMAEDAITRFEQLGVPTEAAKVRLVCSLAQARAGNADRALLLLEEAGDTFAGAGLLVHAGLVALRRAMLHLEGQRWSAAAAEAEKAQVILAQRGSAVRQAHAALIRAQSALGLEDWDTATAMAESALATARARDARWLIPESLRIMGRVSDARGNPERALVAYGAAVAAVQQLHGSLPMELRTTFLQDKMQPYHDAIDVSLRLLRPRLALAYLENAKSQTLTEYLTRRPAARFGAQPGRRPDQLTELATLREEHHALYSRRYGDGLGRASDGIPEGAGDEHLQAAIAQRERRINQLLEQVALERFEERTAPGQQAGEDSAPPRVDADTVLLEYYLREDAAAVFVASAADLEVVPLNARPAELRRLLHAWQVNLNATTRALAAGEAVDGLARHARGTLERLYRLLLQPLAGRLAGYRKLVVVPYSSLHAVPFHALYDGEQYVLERLEVSVSPSYRALQVCRERPRRGGRSALVIANSDDGRLPAVLAEARAVAALLPGESYLEAQATRGALAACAPRYGVIHLATHAEARLDNPTFAHLKLADGQLSAVDIFSLDLPGALVTLSACETGRSVVAAGDEPVGLSRAFLYAGASTLVQSLWRVEDDSTARLMARFYAALREGQAKGAALRAAQLSLLGSGGGHPYVWAPFQLIGDDGAL